MKNVRACEGNTNTIQADYISLEILHRPFTRWVCQRFCIVNSFGGTRWFDRTCGYTAWCLEQRRRWLLALRFCTLGMRFSEDLPPASFRRGLSYQIASIFWGIQRPRNVVLGGRHCVSSSVFVDACLHTGCLHTPGILESPFFCGHINTVYRGQVWPRVSGQVELLSC